MTALDAVRTAAQYEMDRHVAAGYWMPNLELAYGVLPLRLTAGELVSRLSYVLPPEAITRIRADALMAEAVGPSWFSDRTGG